MRADAAASRQAEAIAPSTVAHAVARLDGWFETMRGPGGYGGPVAHWWQQSLLYTGPGLDWRYEGLIAGYLHLWRNSDDPRWLAKARRCGDDLLAGQQPDGHFAASAFEANPATAGTPHEAACDVGLLLLAQALREDGSDGWEPYVECAASNLRRFYLGQLWDAEAGILGDAPCTPSFVPNKGATACEALLLLAAITDDTVLVERYVLPTLDQILALQRVERGPLGGAIAQNSFGAQRVESYFPLYIARCVPALVRGYTWTGNERYIDGALGAMGFVARHMLADGSFPTVVYPNQRVNRYPSWVAPLGDILRAADQLREFGFDANLRPVEQRLLAGQDATGGIQTASGFAGQASGRPSALPDVRDLLHVVGWCDKAFRYLASRAVALPPCQSGMFVADCTFGGKLMQFVETPEVVEIGCGGEVRYRWVKGQPRAEVAAREFWLR